MPYRRDWLQLASTLPASTIAGGARKLTACMRDALIRLGGLARHYHPSCLCGVGTACAIETCLFNKADALTSGQQSVKIACRHVGPHQAGLHMKEIAYSSPSNELQVMTIGPDAADYMGKLGVCIVDIIFARTSARHLLRHHDAKAKRSAFIICVISCCMYVDEGCRRPCCR